VTRERQFYHVSRITHHEFWDNYFFGTTLTAVQPFNNSHYRQACWPAAEKALALR